MRWLIASFPWIVCLMAARLLSGLVVARELPRVCRRDEACRLHLPGILD